MVLRSMIPVAFLMPLVEKYALKVGIGLVAAVVAIGFYFYWHGKSFVDRYYHHKCAHNLIEFTNHLFDSLTSLFAWVVEQ